MPALSIALIPCYNGDKFLHESVLSLLKQTHPLDQIVVIDDSSTDGSRATIQAIEQRHPSVRGIYFDRNQGKAACLNECFERFSPTYFFLQDADDVAQPNRIERQVAFMEGHPEVVCSSSFVRYIDRTGRRIGKGTLDLLDEARLQEYLRSDDPFGLFCPAVVLRGATMKNPRLRFRQQFWPADDIDLWNRIAEEGHKVLAQPEYLVNYRIHGSSAVTSSFQKTREKFEFVRACLRARRRGDLEPSWESFQEARQARPLHTRLNDWRKCAAKGLYRKAGFCRGERRYALAAASLLLAACLQPLYVARRLRQQAS